MRVLRAAVLFVSLMHGILAQQEFLERLPSCAVRILPLCNVVQY
jgi:hypothetical protein